MIDHENAQYSLFNSLNFFKLIYFYRMYLKKLAPPAFLLLSGNISFQLFLRFAQLFSFDSDVLIAVSRKIDDVTSTTIFLKLNMKIIYFNEIAHKIFHIFKVE